MGLEVLCILPYLERRFLDCAVRSFEAQTYPNKRVWLWDTANCGLTIGEIRNKSIRDGGSADLIAHFDADDWSAAERLAEQVAFMEASGADVVGYSDLAFYDVTGDRVVLYESNTQHYSPGTALLYKRAVWEAVAFPDSMVEDTTWQHSVLRAGFRIESESSIRNGSPRLIARMHPGNTTVKYGANYQPASKELESAVRACIGAPLVVA